MEALQYLKEKYEKEGNAIYFREPDLPMSTSLERICKYMQEYADSHTAAHTAGLRETIHDRDSLIKIQADFGVKINTENNLLKERVKELEDRYNRLNANYVELIGENTRLHESLEEAKECFEELAFLSASDQASVNKGVKAIKEALKNSEG